MKMKRLLTCCCVALTLGLLPGCSRDNAPQPLGPLTVKDDHGAVLLSVGPLKDGKLQEPFDPAPGTDILSGRGQTSHNAGTGNIDLYAGRLTEGHYLLFVAATEIEMSVRNVATDLQPITVAGQPAVGLRCTNSNAAHTTYAVVIFHTGTGTVWFNLSADTAQFDKAWATVTSSMKVAKTVPFEARTDLKAFNHDTKKYPTCTAP
jgi:hypothetical protein